ncbi:hypothetical protein C2W62_18045 [Candidatus Entotheonella serta]|nr:hypothetical protein C2W62_18045 [Candidatus Entotheonella serta]
MFQRFWICLIVLSAMLPFRADAAGSSWEAPKLKVVLRGLQTELRWTSPDPHRDSAARSSLILTSYRVYYGLKPRGANDHPTGAQYPSSFKVPASQNAVILNGLLRGRRYFFAVTALDSNHRESRYSNEQSLLIPTPPNASFQAHPASGPAPLTVVFGDHSQGDGLRRSWNFDDGHTSSKAKVRHTYTKPGKYYVQLTIFSSGGSDVARRIIIVSAPPISPRVATPKPAGHPQIPVVPPTRRESRPVATEPNPSMPVHSTPGPTSVSTASFVSPGGHYRLDMNPGDDGFTYLGASDSHLVQHVNIIDDRFANRFGSTLHIASLSTTLTPDEAFVYFERMLWHTWRHVHPKLQVYLVRQRLHWMPLNLDDMNGSRLPYLARMSGAIGHLDYRIRLAVMQGKGRTYMCILASPDGGSIFDWQQNTGFKQHNKKAESFFAKVLANLHQVSGRSQIVAVSNGHRPATTAAFIAAARDGNTAVVQTILGQGVSAEMRNRYDMTPLMVAAAHGHTDTVRVLLEAGANVNARAPWGTSAMIAAALNGHQETVKVLKIAGGS